MAASTSASTRGRECHSTLSRQERNSQQGDPQQWPFAAGFETDYEQPTPIKLGVKGTIPNFAAGTLYRTGPGNYKVKTEVGGTFEISHWFDGFTTVHRFSIRQDSPDAPVSVYYSSRRTVDEQIERIRRTGLFVGFSFGQKRDPCDSYFNKVTSSFKFPGPSSKNVGVTLTASMPGIGPTTTNLSSSHSSKLDSLITTTDANIYQKLDPETLEPKGLCFQTNLHPELSGPLSGAHAETCPTTGDVFNYNLTVDGNQGIYRVFQAKASTGKTEILATIRGMPAYLHSMFLTENTVILCIWNSHYVEQPLSTLYNENMLDSIAAFDKSQPAIWCVIDRSPAHRGLLAIYQSAPFFCFHTINAYEEPSSTTPGHTDIIADLVTYPDLSVLHRFYYKNLLPKSPDQTNDRAETRKLNASARYSRFRLPKVPLPNSKSATTAPVLTNPAIIERYGETTITPELPTINPQFKTRNHRFVYGVSDTGKSSFFDGLIKLDTQTKRAQRWSQLGQTAGEPIFIAHNTDGLYHGEDDGVLLSVVLDGFKGTSYLLCLDARNMQELGRAEVPDVVGFGFHGLHIPN